MKPKQKPHFDGQSIKTIQMAATEAEKRPKTSPVIFSIATLGALIKSQPREH